MRYLFKIEFINEFFIHYISEFFQTICSLFIGVRLWQILVKKIFQSLYESLINHLFHYTNKNISVKPLFNLHYPSLFQLPFYSFKNFSVHGGSCRNYSPKSLGFFWKIFRWVYKKKNCYLPAKVGINCALSSVPVLKTLGIHTSMCNV